jgi:hypothetical protein
MAKSSNPEITADGKFRGVVYCRTHIALGKPYVGETDNEKKRIRSWDNKGSKSYGGTKIMKARQDYGIGPDIWDYEVLEELIMDSHDELIKTLLSRQTYWIKEKDAVKNGYCGSYGDGNLGNEYSEERRHQCGNAMRGKHHTEETKALLRAKSKKGVPRPKEITEKIRAKLIGKKRTEAQKKAQSERQKGVIPVAATAAAKEWVKQNGGSYWKNHPIPDEARANMKKAQQERGTDCIATFPDGHEETFPTMLDAAKATGLNAGSVKYSIEHNSTTYNGYKFRKL